MLTFGFKFGGTWGGIPGISGLLSWSRESFYADNKLTDITPGRGDYEADNAISLAIDVGDTIVFAAMDAGVTLTSHSGTATCSLTTGTLTCSVAGSLYDLVLSDDTEYPCAEGAGSTIRSYTVGAPEGTLNGFTIPDDWTSSALFGHSWKDYSEGLTDNVEQVISGDFDSSTGWVLLAGLVIENGLLTSASAVNSEATQNSVTETGLDYVLRIKLVNVTNGSLRVRNSGAQWLTPSYNEDGIYEYTINSVVATNLVIDTAMFVGSVDYVSIEEIPQGKIPQSLTTPTQDVYGNLLTNAGDGRQSFDVVGYTGTWDGAAYGVLGISIVLSGGFTLRAEGVVPDTSADQRSIVGSNDSISIIRFLDSTRILVSSGGTSVFFGHSLSVGDDFVMEISVSSLGICAIILNGIALSFVTPSTDFNVTTSDYVIDTLGSRGGTADKYLGSLHYIKLYNAADTLINHWVPQSSKTSEQTTIYDKVGGGGNHAALTGATVPFFTTEMAGSDFALGGSEGLTDNVELLGQEFADWSQFVSGGTFVDNGSSFTLTRVNGTTIVQQGVLANGSDYRCIINVLAVSGSSIRVINSAGDTLLDIGIAGVGVHEFQFSHTIADANLLVSCKVDGDTVTWNSLSLEEIPEGIIPADPANPTLDIFGNALTFTGALSAPAGVIDIKANETLERSTSDPENYWLDASGDAINIDVSTIAENRLDKDFKTDTKGLACYDSAQVEPTLTRIKNFMGI